MDIYAEASEGDKKKRLCLQHQAYTLVKDEPADDSGLDGVPETPKKKNAKRAKAAKSPKTPKTPATRASKGQSSGNSSTKTAGKRPAAATDLEEETPTKAPRQSKRRKAVDNKGATKAITPEPEAGLAAPSTETVLDTSESDGTWSGRKPEETPKARRPSTSTTSTNAESIHHEETVSQGPAATTTLENISLRSANRAPTTFTSAPLSQSFQLPAVSQPTAIPAAFRAISGAVSDTVQWKTLYQSLVSANFDVQEQASAEELHNDATDIKETIAHLCAEMETALSEHQTSLHTIRQATAGLRSEFLDEEIAKLEGHNAWLVLLQQKMQGWTNHQRRIAEFLTASQPNLVAFRSIFRSLSSFPAGPARSLQDETIPMLRNTALFGNSQEHRDELLAQFMNLNMSTSSTVGNTSGNASGTQLSVPIASGNTPSVPNSSFTLEVPLTRHHTNTSDAEDNDSTPKGNALDEDEASEESGTKEDDDDDEEMEDVDGGFVDVNAVNVDIQRAIALGIQNDRRANAAAQKKKETRKASRILQQITADNSPSPTAATRSSRRLAAKGNTSTLQPPLSPKSLSRKRADERRKETAREVEDEDSFGLFTPINKLARKKKSGDLHADYTGLRARRDVLRTPSPTLDTNPPGNTRSTARANTYNRPLPNESLEEYEARMSAQDLAAEVFDPFASDKEQNTDSPSPSLSDLNPSLNKESAASSAEGQAREELEQTASFALGSVSESIFQQRAAAVTDYAVRASSLPPLSMTVETIAAPQTASASENTSALDAPNVSSQAPIETTPDTVSTEPTKAVEAPLKPKKSVSFRDEADEIE